MKIKMRQLNIFSFSLIIVVVMIIILVFIYQQNGFVSESIIKNSETDFIDEIESSLNLYFDIPKLIINSQYGTFSESSLDLNNDDDVAKHFSTVINALPNNIYSFTYGTEQGTFYGARRVENATQFYKSDASTGGHSFYYDLTDDYAIKAFNSDFGLFDPRTREWYKTALVNDDVVFSSIYEHFVMHDLTLSTSKVIKHKEEVLGVLGVHMTLSQINDFLKKEAMTESADVYIIDNKTGKLVASSKDVQNFIEVDDKTIRAITVDELNNKTIAQAFHNQYKSKRVKIENEGRFRISSTNYQKLNLDLQIITLIPENQYLSYLSSSFTYLIISLISVLLIGIFIWSRVNKVMFSPLDQLVTSISKFAGGERQFIIKESSIVELDRLSNAFLEMTETISSHIEKLEALNKEYDHAKHTAENANNSKSMFLANMSHEIRTPLNGIIGFADIVEQTPLNDDQLEMVGAIRESSKMLLEIINNILDISRIEAGKVNVNLACTDLYLILNQNIRMFTALAEKKGLKFIADIPENLPKYIFTDEMMLSQIIVNLLGNAVKYTNHGEITFKVRVHETQKEEITLNLDVQDTGIGIKTDELESIFDLFVQSDSSKDKKTNGTGLGLTIVKDLVRLLEGEIHVTSTFGIGSVFTVELNTVKIDECRDSERENFGVEKSTTLPRILLVEDDRISQLLIKKVAERFGWELEVASNGFEALEILDELSFDIILMDIQMPEMNGLKVTQLIRSKETESKNVTIIGMSAYAMQSNINEALEAGMNDYITKPIDFKELNRVVLKYL